MHFFFQAIGYDLDYDDFHGYDTDIHIFGFGFLQFIFLFDHLWSMCVFSNSLCFLNLSCTGLFMGDFLTVNI